MTVHRANLTREDAEQVWARLEAGESAISVASAFNIGVNAVYRMRSGGTWRDVTGLADPHPPQERAPRRPGEHVHRWKLEAAEQARERAGVATGPLLVHGWCDCGEERDFPAAHDGWPRPDGKVLSMTISPWRHRAGRGFRDREAEAEREAARST